MRTLLVLALFSVLSGWACGTTIATDGSLGPAAQTLSAENGVYTIDQALGQRAGNNLFHSFERFSIGTDESATFTGADNIQNVISRVTGGEVSNIDGLLRSTIGTADLYFLNPAGVIFGPNARLDLPGAFHVSTADYIQLGDQDLFYSDRLESEVLSTAAPAAFGFLEVVEGSIEVDGAELALAEGHTLSLVGGTVEIKNQAQLTTAAGQVNLISAASAGEAVLVTENGDLDHSGFAEMGEISVRSNSAVNVAGTGGGRIFIRGGQVVIEDSVLSARTEGNNDGKGVDIAADRSFDFSRSLIDTRTSGTGDAGDVTIRADRIGYDLVGASADIVGIFSDLISNEIRLFLDISHPLSSELTATVTNPSGTEVRLFSNILGTGSNFTDTIFNDSAESSITAYAAPFSGEFIPEGALSSFIGEEFNGTWTLSINDGIPFFNSGTLNSWGLEFEGQRFNSSNVPQNIGEFGFRRSRWKWVPYAFPNTSSELTVSDFQPANGSAGAITIIASQMEVLVDSDNLHISTTGIEPGALTFDLGTITRYGHALNPDLIRIDEGRALLPSRIAYDGSLNAYAGLAQKTANAYQIEPKHGRVVSDNLFYSFSDFTLFKGETATFESRSGIERIIARVTGGNVLFVDGTLQSAASGVDLFLFNPSGVVFGPHGQLDLNTSFASLNVSTADSLVWDEGAGRFGAIEPTAADQTLLASGIPDVFGFVDDTIGPIHVLGGGWPADRGKSITFIGGKLRFVSPHEGLEVIRATSGAINLISLDAAGELYFNSESSVFNTDSFEAFGTIHLDRFSLDVSGKSFSDYWREFGLFDRADSGPNGSIFVRGGGLTLSNDASFQANTASLESGVSGELIQIELEDDLELVSGGKIDVSTNFLSLANGGSVSIHAGNVMLDDQASGSGTGIFSRARGSGNSGNVMLHVDGHLHILNGAKINVSADALGNAGNVSIHTEHLTLNNEESLFETGIRSRTFGTGNAGDVTIEVADHLQLLNGATITASTWFHGNGGDIWINANNLTLENTDFSAETAIFSRTYSDGSAGNVFIEINDHLQIINGATIDMSVYSFGDGGDLSINTNNLTIDGQYLSSKTAIFAQTLGRGNAGNVSVHVSDHLQLLNGGQIDSSTFTLGNSGNVSIHATDLTIDDNGQNSNTAIVSQAFGNGAAGNVSVHVSDHLQLLNGGRIDASAYAFGNCGNVFIHAGNLTIDDEGYSGQTERFSQTAIFSTSLGIGNSGSVFITVDNHLQLLNGGSIDVSAYSFGDGGNVSIDAGNLTIDDNGNNTQTAIYSLAFGAGSAGNISIEVDDHLQLLNGGRINTDAYSLGTGGDISINATNLTLDNEQPASDTGIASRAFGAGNAGNVSIDIQEHLQLSNGATIKASTVFQGNGGDVSIDAANLTLNNGDFGSETAIFARTYGVGQGGGVDITVEDHLQLLNGAGIDVSAYSFGEGGNVSVYAKNLTFNSQEPISENGIRSRTFGSGDAGNVSINIEERMQIFNGGKIDVSTGILDNDVLIDIEQPLQVLREISPNLQVLDEIRQQSRGLGEISEQSQVFGEISQQLQDLSQITVQQLTNLNGVGELLTFLGGIGELLPTPEQITALLDGNIIVDNELLDEIQQTLRNIDVGSIDVSRSSGKAGNIRISSDHLLIKNNGAISSSTLTEGKAGNISIEGNTLRLSDKANISSSSVSTDLAIDQTGDAGTITINMRGDIELRDNATITTASKLSNAGSVRIHADGQLYLNNSTIDIKAGQGVTANGLQPSNRFRLDNPTEEASLTTFLSEFAFPELSMTSIGDLSIVANSVVNAKSGFLGGAVSLKSIEGCVRIDDSTVTLESDQSGLNLSNLFDPASGTLDVGAFRKDYPRLFPQLSLEAASCIEVVDSTLTTDAGLSAQAATRRSSASDLVFGFGGSINLKVPQESAQQLIALDGSELRAESNTMGGNISVHGYTYVVNHADIIARAQSVGGNYTIDVTNWLQSVDSSIDLSGAQAGQVISDTTFVDLSAALAKLSLDFLSANRFSGASCDLYYAQAQSSFIVQPARLDGLSVEDYMPSAPPAYLHELEYISEIADEADEAYWKELLDLDLGCSDCI